MEFTLNLSLTSSRAANRRGRDTFPKPSCLEGVNPENLDLPLLGTKINEEISQLRRRWLLAMTTYAKISLTKRQPGNTFALS